MGAWLEAYRQLPEDAQDRVQRWLHLQKFIAHSLKLDWETWVDDFLTPCMQAPLDYAFMEVCLPGFTGFEGVEGQGVTFSRDVDPATAAVARVPLRAQNNLGRLSPELQDQLAGLLEGADAGPHKLSPADVNVLQKMLRSEKALAKLARPLFRKVEVLRDDNEVVLRVEGGDELVRQSVHELGTFLRKAFV
ncbi:MAG: hypothetical protein KC933_36335 [Myxococcales bacterium]|nr:hypothetical protein [Myxococcales bacterium]MCB9650166.1 hypothetical protein [Deltaproteobacteria bacterium]